MESSSMSSQPPTSWRNSSEYWTEGWPGEGRKAGRHQTSGWRGYEEDPSQCVSFTPFPAGAAHGLLSLPVPGQLTAQFFLSFLPSPPLQAKTSGSPSHFTVGSWYGRLDCWQLGRKGCLSSLPREQQKAQERQELWRGLEELQLRRLQGAQGAKEAPLPRPPPQVAASGGQS